MRLTRKVMALAMASTMAVSLTACGGGKAAETTAAPAAAETTAAATEAAKEAETTAAAAEESVAAGGNIGVCIYKYILIIIVDFRINHIGLFFIRVNIQFFRLNFYI